MLGASTVLIAVKGLTTLSAMALSVLLARTLGAEGYGLYLFTLTIAHMLALPVLAGLPTLITRQTAIYRSQGDWSGLRGIVLWSQRFVFVTTAAIICLGLGSLALVPHLVTDLSPVYFLSLPLIFCLAFMQVASAVLRGFEFPVWGQLPDSAIRPLLLLVLVAVTALLGLLTPATAMTVHVMAATAALAWAVWMTRHHCPTHPPNHAVHGRRFETRAWLSSLLPLSLITAAGMINSRIDLLILGMLAGKESVAVYGLAAQISGLVLAGQTIVNSIIGPKIARLHVSGDKVLLQSLITQACRLSSLIALFCVVSILVFGDWVVSWLVGAEFSESARIAAIVSVGYLFSAMMGPVALLLNMTGHEWLTMKVIWGSAALNTVLNLLLIPVYGAYGAAVATLVSTVLSQGCLVFISMTVLKVQTMLVQWRTT